MAAATESSIWLALRSGIESLPLTPMLPIAWPGTVYEPEKGVEYLAIGEVYTAPRRVLINRPLNDRAGSLTIVAVCKVNQDPSVYRQIGGTIAEHFTGCLRYCDLTLTLMSEGGRVAHADAGYRDGSWFRVPVICPWRTWR